jgi:hypothetical protein
MNRFPTWRNGTTCIDPPDWESIHRLLKRLQIRAQFATKKYKKCTQNMEIVSRHEKIKNKLYLVHKI